MAQVQFNTFENVHKFLCLGSKSQYVSNGLCHALANSSLIRIEQKFFVVGHTFMEVFAF